MRLFVVLMLVACQSSEPTRKASPADPPPPVTTPTQPQSLAKAHNNFALDLWMQLPSGNLAISPPSITIALAMPWAGAKGATAEEMRTVLRLDAEPDLALSRWSQVFKSITDEKRTFKLEIANRLFADQHREMDSIFFDVNMQAFGARTDVMNFRDDAEGSRTKINFWVSNATHGRIPELLPPQSVNAASRLVIVNAIYFVAQWASPFDKASTKPAKFLGGKQVDMMHRLGNMRYAHDAGAALVELPYANNEASMYVLLPDADDGLPAVEAKLGDTLRMLQGKLADRTVHVGLPRFKLQPGTLDLAKRLQTLGIRDAFDRTKADFSGISKIEGDDRLYISAVLHQAIVIVDEKGTEAAAATAVASPTGAGAPPKAIDFIADHPFLFLIVDRATGVILFLGRVTEP